MTFTELQVHLQLSRNCRFTYDSQNCRYTYAFHKLCRFTCDFHRTVVHLWFSPVTFTELQVHLQLSQNCRFTYDSWTCRFTCDFHRTAGSPTTFAELQVDLWLSQNCKSAKKTQNIFRWIASVQLTHRLSCDWCNTATAADLRPSVQGITQQLQP